MKYIGWIFSLVLLGLLIYVYLQANSTSSYLNNQLRAQADNFTSTYAALVAQQNAREAQWQTTLNVTLAAQDEQWKTALNAAVAARDAYWQNTLNAYNATMVVRDAQWQTIVKNTVDVLNAQWQISVDAALAAQANYYKNLLAQYGVPQ